MLEKPISSLILFGTSLRYLQETLENVPIKREDSGLGILTRFLKNLDEFGLSVTRRASWDLAQKAKELEKSADDALMSKEQAKEIESIVKRIRPTLLAETEGMIAYIVSERRFPIENLIDDHKNMFSNGVFGKLPPIAQQDFSESMKCLAFERPTAAAFHMLRRY